VDPRSGENRQFSDVCVPKPGGVLELTLNMPDLGFPSFGFGVRCLGELVGEPAADGSQNVFWRVDQSPINFRTTLDGQDIVVERAEGQFTTRLADLAQPEDDPDPPCVDGSWRHVVSLETVPAELPNEVVLRIAAIIPVSAWAHELALRGRAGSLQTVVPQRLRVTRFVAADEGPVCVAEAVQRFDFDVVLSGLVRSHHTPSGPLLVEVGAEVWAINPDDPVVPINIVPPSPIPVYRDRDRGRFAVEVPPDFYGHITLRARVDSSDPYTFGGLYVYPDQTLCVLTRLVRWSEGWAKWLAWRPFPECPACLIRGFNDRGDVIGIREGAAFRLLTHGRPEYLTKLLRGNVSPQTVNSHGHIAGGAIDEHGRPYGFIIGDTVGEATVFEDVWLAALNDDGAAVGYRYSDDRAIAVEVKDGEATVLDVKGEHSVATAVNNAGELVGVAMDKKRTRPFIRTKDGVEFLHGLDGQAAVVTAINDSGVIVGASRTKDGTSHAVVYSAKNKHARDLGVLEGFESSHASDINAAGVVVGTLSSSGGDAPSHGFIYSDELGMRDLNTFIGNLGVVIEGAIKVNNRGEIVVYGRDHEGSGYFVIKASPEPPVRGPVGRFG